jgi:nucleoside 2-deoxyribosyltransferase
MATLFSFQAHPFSEAERLWLETAAREKPFDARGARARLHGRLPKDFKPQAIDSRFYSEDRLTLLGMRRFSPDDEIFKVIEDVASTLKAKILSNPTLDSVSIKDIAESTGHSEAKTRTAVEFLSDHGLFFQGLTTGSGGEVDSVWLGGPRGYDAILEFDGVDALLQAWHEARRRNLLDVTGSGEFDLFMKSASAKPDSASLKRDTAFVIMPIDPSKPELEDVLGAVKEVCNSFGVKAYRADEIEHQDRITNVILNEIRDCDILIADLSHERPNVYYEIGYAHALNKKPILYRKQGTRLHFDLSVHNVPEYRNITELRELLRRRLEAILGRAPNAA